MRIDEIRNAYFAQKTKWNANCDFSIEQDKFVIRSATMNYSHEEVENAEYAVFKAGVACQQERIDKLEAEIGVWQRRWEADQKRMDKANAMISKLMPQLREGNI